MIQPNQDLTATLRIIWLRNPEFQEWFKSVRAAELNTLTKCSLDKTAIVQGRCQFADELLRIFESPETPQQSRNGS